MKYFTAFVLQVSICAVAILAHLSPSQAQSAATPALTQQQLEKLVEPIALYPDLLLQHVLVASTFPEQVLDAALYHQQGKKPEGIKDQPWDEAVKAVANYPSVLTVLASDLDWTITLGGAFINQNEALRNSIQVLRLRAKTVGNLKDSDQQNVIEEQSTTGSTVIRIEPTQPQTVYVPANTTTVVYEQPVETADFWAPVASFGVGMALGYAMADDDDDDHYYYGGGGYYGPGFWHGNDAMDDYVDFRKDRWNDTYDYAKDRQDYRQDTLDDRREHRQELGRKQQEWRQEQGRTPANLSPEKRAEASSRLNSAKSTRSAEANARLESAKASRGTGSASSQRQARGQSYSSSSSAQQRSHQERSHQERSQSYKSQSANRSYQSSGRSYGGSSYSGMGSSRSSVNSSHARGSASRARSGGGRMGGGGGRRR